MSWDAHKEFTELATQARKAFCHVCGDLAQIPVTVGKHEARNHEHLRQIYTEAKEKFPRLADTLAWLLWHDIVDADRLAWLSKNALLEAERRGAERMRERAAAIADQFDAKRFYETYRAEYNRKRYDVAGVERMQRKALNIQAEDARDAIRALPLTEETTDADA